MRVVFMGTPAFALPALTALIDSPHKVVAVYSQPPRPAGRGMRLVASPVHHLAEMHDIGVFTPASLKPADAQATFAGHRADVAVVAAYGLLLPQAILDAPRFGCINIHPSDLPRWRGAAPIQRSVMAGDRHTACCIMRMDAGLDTGPVLNREPLPIPTAMHAGLLHDELAAMGARQMLAVLDALIHGTVTAVPQSMHGITYAEKIAKADRLIQWTQPAAQIVDQIRGLNPSPAAMTVIHGETIKIFAACEEKGSADHPPGITLDDALLINAGNASAVRLTELQRPGKSRAAARQCLLGFAVPAGTVMQNPITG